MTEIPETVRCAECGKALTWANSYGLSVPINTRQTGKDFCCIAHVAKWAAEHAEDFVTEFDA